MKNNIPYVGKVYEICRDCIPLKKQRVIVEYAEDLNIELYLKVNEEGKVTSIVFKKCLRTIDPETQKFDPVYDENETMELKADHIVFAIGQSIEWGNLLDGTKVEFWRGNYPVADPLTYQTAEPDIFVGGDVYHGPKFAIDAIEEGKCAAESLHPGSIHE